MVKNVIKRLKNIGNFLSPLSLLLLSVRLSFIDKTATGGHAN